jgi:hypothetical protein
MDLDAIHDGQRVIYVPHHAAGDPRHRDCEHGMVSSTNHVYAFVRFDQAVARHGWDRATSQSCDPETLVREVAW